MTYARRYSLEAHWAMSLSDPWEQTLWSTASFVKRDDAFDFMLCVERPDVPRFVVLASLRGFERIPRFKSGATIKMRKIFPHRRNL